MKKLFLFLLSVVMLGFTACKDSSKEDVKPATGYLTSISATIVSDDDSNGAEFKLPVTDLTLTDFVIPVPYYYPETSDNETTEYLKKMKLNVALAANYKITPGLGNPYDLTQKNKFTITGPGVNKEITISAERVKSSAADFLTFAIEGVSVSAVINVEEGKITLVTEEAIPANGAVYTLSAHAQGVSPDPATITDWNTKQTFTVTAHDGTTTKEWTVEKGTVDKKNMGINKMKLVANFPLDVVTAYGNAFAANGNHIPSLAAIGSYIILCNSGQPPIYVDKTTGVKVGEVALPGGFNVSSVTNDGAGNLLLCNAGNTGEGIKIYTTSDVTQEPTPLCEFASGVDNTGYTIKAVGDVKGNAVITLLAAYSAKFTQVVIKEGEEPKASVIEMTASDGTSMVTGMATQPYYMSDVVAASSNPADGYFYGRAGNWANGADDKNPRNHFFYLNESGAEVSRLDHGYVYDGEKPYTMGCGGFWINSVDCKEFNKATFVAAVAASNFTWEPTQISLLNVTNKSILTTGTLQEGSAVEFVNEISGEANKAEYEYDPTTYGITDASGRWTTDVVLSPSKNGYYLYMYVYSVNNASLSAYVADCIK